VLRVLKESRVIKVRRVFWEIMDQREIREFKDPMVLRV
jgi:hypothetical protein